MKRLLNMIMCAFCLTAFIVACSVKDEAMPMSQENIEKLHMEIAKAYRSFAPSPSQDSAEALVDIYKKVVEKKMGYNFDKTFRSMILFYPTVLTSGIYHYIIDNPERALKKSFISQRTFDILKIGKQAKWIVLTDKETEGLLFVIECQKQNGGICDEKSLLKVLTARISLPPYLSHERNKDEDMWLMQLQQYLDQKYSFYDIDRKNLLIAPDGSVTSDVNGYTICTNRLIHFCTGKFVVNFPLIELARKYAIVYEEEKAALIKNNAK